MSNFKAKLAFFQNAGVSQPHQPAGRPLEPRPQRATTLVPVPVSPNLADNNNTNTNSSNNNQQTSQNQQPSILSRPHSPKQQSEFVHPTTKPSIVVPKPSGGNFKNKLAFFNQAQQQQNQQQNIAAAATTTTTAATSTVGQQHLAPLHPTTNTSNDDRSHLKPLDNNYLSDLSHNNNKRDQMIAMSKENNENNVQVNNNKKEVLPYIQQQSQIQNNENVPQPLISQQAAPKQSFKDKMAMVAALQQPMGAYDYKQKKKKEAGQKQMQQQLAPIIVEPPAKANMPASGGESALPVLRGGRRPTRRPTILSPAEPSQTPPQVIE